MILAWASPFNLFIKRIENDYSEAKAAGLKVLICRHSFHWHIYSNHKHDKGWYSLLVLYLYLSTHTYIHT